MLITETYCPPNVFWYQLLNVEDLLIFFDQTNMNSTILLSKNNDSYEMTPLCAVVTYDDLTSNPLIKKHTILINNNDNP